MGKVGRIIDNINEWLGKISSYFLIFIMLIMLIEVISRYVFRRPTLWAWDVNMQLFAAIIFLGAGYHILHRQIITVDVLYDRFPPKIKAVADVISYLCISIFCVTIIWQGSQSAMRSVLAREVTSSVLGPPIYHIKVLIPIAALLMLLQATRQYVKIFADAFSQRGEENGD